MRRKSEITRISNGLYGALKTTLSEAKALKEAKEQGITTGDYDSAHDGIQKVKDIIEAIVKGTDFEGTSVSKFLSSFKSFDADGKLDYIELTIKSKLKAEYPYRSVVTIKADDTLIDKMCDAYADALIQLLYIDLAGENIGEINALINQIVTENNIPISFGFTISDKTNSFIASIDNSKVVFNASIANAFELSKNAMFQEGDEYADRVRETAIEGFVENLKALQTTPQIIKSGLSIITDLTGLKTKKRAERLIRQTYHKQAIHFNAVKEGVGYYEATVTVDGEEVEIFALLKKDADGEISVILNPFNVKTLFTVDYDVLAAVKAEMK